MSQPPSKAQEKFVEPTRPAPTSTAAQQSDNVAHALAGAGGGLLSMALTYALRDTWPASMLTHTQLSTHYAVHTRPGRIETRPVVDA